jgi:hypothetical protein
MEHVVFCWKILVFHIDMDRHRYNQKGVTLIEVLLYSALSIGLMVSIISFVIFFTGIGSKSRTLRDINTQGTFAVHSFTSVVRNGDSITLPAQGNSGAVASIEKDGNTYVFSESGGRFSYTEDGGSPIYLTSEDMTVSNLSFENYSLPDTPGNIRIQFTLTKGGAGGSLLPEFSFEEEFIGGASMRLPE